MRLAIVTTHPIQYNAPWFRLLANEPGIIIRVFYTWEQSQTNAKYDPGFGKVVSWDIPLLDGYDYVFIKNIAPDPGSHHFKGIDNPGLINEIKQWRPDALLVIGWPFKSHLAVLRYFKGKVPVLFRGDSTLLDEQPGIKKIARRLLLRYIYLHVDYALYVGTNNKKYFLAHGLKETQLYYTPHAIDNDRFGTDDNNYAVAAREWRRELGINDSDFVLLYAGKLEPVKNPGYMIQLASQTTNQKFKFVIVGNGPLEQELKRRSAHDPRIIFIDFQNQQKMPVVYRLGNVIILPSNSETWGLAINEAMACGRPVIASFKCGGAVDLIKGNGLIVDTIDFNSTINYINTLYADRELYNRTCDTSKQIIKSFSFEHIKNGIVALLRCLGTSR